MNYITKSTFHKISSTYEVLDILNKDYDDEVIEFDELFFVSLVQFFDNFEIIEVSCFHIRNDFKEGTYHSLKDCKVLNSPYINVKFPNELTEKIVKDSQFIGKNSSEIKELIDEEGKKFDKRFKRVVLINTDIKTSKNNFKKEVFDVWGIEVDLEYVVIPNSGIIEIENINLLELRNTVRNILSDIVLEFTNISVDEALIIIFKLYTQKSDLKYSENKYYEIENKIIDFIKLKQDELNLTFEDIFESYFRIFVNKKMDFKSNLFTQLGLIFCPSDCSIKMVRDRRQRLLKESENNN